MQTTAVPVMHSFLTWMERLLGFMIVQINNAQASYQLLDHVNPKALLGIFGGLLLIFYGAHFIVTFTIVEAFRHGGSEIFFHNLTILWDQLKSVEEAEKEDDLIDSNQGKLEFSSFFFCCF